MSFQASPTQHPVILKSWSFRVECSSDLEPLMTNDWHQMGVFIEELNVKRVESGLPDMECTITLSAASDEAFKEGLFALVRRLSDDCLELHVLLDTLKPVAHYDGKRDGPFSDGGFPDELVVTRTPSSVFDPAHMKAEVNARLTDSQRGLAKKRSGQLRAGHLNDRIEQARPHYKAGRTGQACGFVCIESRRVSSIREGLYVGCGYCEPCLALKEILSGTSGGNE